VSFRAPVAARPFERTFGTLQDRLGQEPALAGITDIEAANAFIREVYFASARSICPPTMPASPLCRPARAWPSPPFPPCAPAFRQVAGQGPCLSRSMSIPTARPLSPAATTRTERSEMRKAPLKSARRRNPVDGMDKPLARLPRAQANKAEETDIRCATKTGQLNSLSTGDTLKVVVGPGAFA
jgi:hypothetical protein